MPSFIATFWLLASAGLLGSALLLLVSAFWLSLPRYRALVKPAAASERHLLWAALVAAILGSLGLFVLPAYTGSSCSASLSVTVSPPSPSSAPVVSANIPASSCPEHRATFLQVNGPQVIPLFTIPVLFAVVPLVILRLRFRALVFALCAFLLAGQAAVGMSGYGLAFAPSSVLLVIAGLVGIFGRGAQPSAPADGPASLRSAGRG